MENIIIYLRKSRSDDPALSVTDVLARHEQQLQEYAINTYNRQISEDHIYREIVSGETIADRPVMKQVIKLLETGTVDGVLVIEPQRLSRGDLEDCGKIVNTFRYTGTLVITPPKTYNLNDEYDRKFFEMELMRGNDYLEYTKKILNRGRIASVKQGNYIGSVAPYGYKKIKSGSGKDSYHTLEIVPEEADAIRLMYQLFVKEHYGFTKIARYLDDIGVKPRKTDYWSPAAIKDMLENPVYIGKIRWNYSKVQKTIINGQISKTRPRQKDTSQWIYVNGRHEAIIEEAIYNKALEMRGKNPCVRKNKELSNPFAGLLYCGTCGRAMSYKHFKQYRGKSENVCTSMLCNNQAICKTKSIKYDTFYKRVVESLEENVADFEIKLKQEESNGKQFQKDLICSLEAKLNKLKEKDFRQKDAYEDGLYTKEEYATRNAKLQEQISATMESLSKAKSNTPPVIDYRERISRFTDCLTALKDNTLSASEKNVLLKTCIDKIVYYNNMESKPGIGRYVDNVFQLDIFLLL